LETSGNIWEKYFGSWQGKKEGKVLEGHLMSDHLHILLSIPPKYEDAVREYI